MDSSCTIEAHLKKNSPLPFNIAPAKPCHLYFDLTINAEKELAKTDTLVFTFRDLFSDTEPPKEACVYNRPLGKTIAAGKKQVVTVVITDGDTALPPSSYHVRIDLVRDDRSLCALNVGSVRFYLIKDGESADHAAASYIFSRTEFSWNRQNRNYFAGQPIRLPPTLDPFNDESFTDFVKAMDTHTDIRAENIQGGGIGFLHGARMFRALGEMDRAKFCERVLKRSFEDMVFAKMINEEGAVHGLDSFEKDHALTREHRVETAFILKILAQAMLYFYEEGGQADYAESLHEQTNIIAENQFNRPLEIGCGCEDDPSRCTCYDGRVLQGISEWLDTTFAMKGVVDRKQLAKATQFAFTVSKRVLQNNGWYDAHCYGEEHCHIICGNHNILGGLLATLRVVNRYKENVPGYGQPYYFSEVTDARAQLMPAIRSAFEFIAGKQVSITGLPLLFYPGHWGIGHLYKECLELVKMPETAAHARRWLHIIKCVVSSPSITDDIGHYAEYAAMAPLLGMCPEIESLER